MELALLVWKCNVISYRVVVISSIQEERQLWPNCCDIEIHVHFHVHVLLIFLVILCWGALLSCMYMYGVVFSMVHVKIKYYECLPLIFFIWILETCIIVFMAFKSPVHWNLIIHNKRGPPMAFFHWKFCVDHQVSLITLEYVYKTVLTWTTKTTFYC